MEISKEQIKRIVKRREIYDELMHVEQSLKIESIVINREEGDPISLAPSLFDIQDILTVINMEIDEQISKTNDATQGG